MTTAEEYYNIIEHIGAGTLFYLVRKGKSNTEYVFEPLIIDTKNKNLTLNILKRAMDNPSFIAFPGTPEAYEFMKDDVADSKTNP